jgi:sulfur relay (sulfurtransferase) DsrF/TusC family protein
MAKEVTIILSEYPFGTNRFAEKLRMGLGLTLNDDNSLNLVLVKNGRHALKGLDETAIGMNPITRTVKILADMGASIFAESGGGFDYLDSLDIDEINPDCLEPLLERSDIVIT